MDGFSTVAIVYSFANLPITSETLIALARGLARFNIATNGVDTASILFGHTRIDRIACAITALLVPSFAFAGELSSTDTFACGKLSTDQGIILAHVHCITFRFAISLEAGLANTRVVRANAVCIGMTLVGSIAGIDLCALISITREAWVAGASCAANHRCTRSIGVAGFAPGIRKAKINCNAPTNFATSRKILFASTRPFSGTCHAASCVSVTVALIRQFAQIDRLACRAVTLITKITSAATFSWADLAARGINVTSTIICVFLNMHLFTWVDWCAFHSISTVTRVAGACSVGAWVLCTCSTWRTVTKLCAILHGMAFFAITSKMRIAFA